MYKARGLGPHRSPFKNILTRALPTPIAATDSGRLDLISEVKKPKNYVCLNVHEITISSI